MELWHGDCLELMKNISDKSIDMILCDLPYGLTLCEWDKVIPFEPLWEHYERIIKDDGVIVLFSQQPFTSKLVCSNLKMFRYEWIYEKTNLVGFLNAKRMPLKKHENICVFYKHLPTYNPQFTWGTPYEKRSSLNCSPVYHEGIEGHLTISDGRRFPTDILKFNNTSIQGGVGKKVHPTEKPVALLEYLIKTYTTEGDLILDNCMGTGSTGVACKELNRDFIGIEIDKKYFDIAKERIENITLRKRKLF